LRARFYDPVGTAVGSEISTGFVERGTSRGIYQFYTTSAPAGHVGCIDFYLTGQASDPLASLSVNPADIEVQPDYKPLQDADGAIKVVDKANGAALATAGGKMDLVDAPSTTAVASIKTNLGTVPASGNWNTVTPPSLADIRKADLFTGAPAAGFYANQPAAAAVVSEEQISDISDAAASAVLVSLSATVTQIDTLYDQLGVETGDIQYIECKDTDGVVVAGVEVRITSDVAGTALIRIPKFTLSDGKVAFRLPAGTHYVWRYILGRDADWDNPEAITVT
jgi:hypothetical protein